MLTLIKLMDCLLLVFGLTMPIFSLNTSGLDKQTLMDNYEHYKAFDGSMKKRQHPNTLGGVGLVMAGLTGYQIGAMGMADKCQELNPDKKLDKHACISSVILTAASGALTTCGAAFAIKNALFVEATADPEKKREIGGNDPNADGISLQEVEYNHCYGDNVDVEYIDRAIYDVVGYALATGGFPTCWGIWNNSMVRWEFLISLSEMDVDAPGGNIYYQPCSHNKKDYKYTNDQFNHDGHAYI